jgi:hypothetical protein
MKKLLLSTNIITLLALVSILCYNQSCNNSGRPIPNPVDSTRSDDEQVDSACTTCYPNACDSAFTGLNAGLAAFMLQNYKQHQWQSINNGGATTDSRSVWLSLQTIKRFIHDIEKKVCDTCNTTTLNDLGVRIYFAAYPSSADWNTYATHLAGVQQTPSQSRHTIVMVPTYFNGSYDVDFDPNYIGANCVPLTMCQVYDTLKGGLAGTVTVLTPGQVSMQNHGTMDPPASSQTFARLVDDACGGGGEFRTPARPNKEQPKTK